LMKRMKLSLFVILALQLPSTLAQDGSAAAD